LTEIAVLVESDSIAQQWEWEIAGVQRHRVIRQGFVDVLDYTCDGCSHRIPVQIGPLPRHVRVALLRTYRRPRDSLSWYKEEAGKLGANAIMLGAFETIDVDWDGDVTEARVFAIYVPSLDVPVM
jgi:hypothetical protein